MSELLLVSNPKRRRKRARRKNPHRRHRARARRVNPRRRSRARRHNPVMRRYRRGRRNPSLRGIVGQVLPTIKAGAIGAGGALALDAAWGVISPKLPSSLSNAYVQFALKGLAAVLIGMVGNKLLKGKGQQLSVGAMTVVTHDFLKATLQSSMPTVFGAGGSLALSGYNGMGAYLSGSAPIVGTATIPRTNLMSNYAGLGAYLSGDNANQSGSGTYVDDHMGFDPNF